MIILVDAMGGDNAPDAVIKGAVKVVNEVDANIVLIGDNDIINSKVKEFYGKDASGYVSANIEVFPVGHGRIHIATSYSIENSYEMAKEIEKIVKENAKTAEKIIRE